MASAGWIAASVFVCSRDVWFGSFAGPFVQVILEQLLSGDRIHIWPCQGCTHIMDMSVCTYSSKDVVQKVTANACLVDLLCVWCAIDTGGSAI